MTNKNYLITLFESWYYMAENIYYFLTHKKWVDKKIKEYINKKYTKNDEIILAVHGIFEYYWQSFPKYIKFFDKKNKVIIPLKYNYFNSQEECLKEIKNQIELVHKKTNAKIILTGDSLGARLLGRYMLEENPKFIKEFIPISCVWQKIFGVAFWWYWLDKTPKEELKLWDDDFNNKKIPKTKIALYAKQDAFIYPEKKRLLANVDNIGFNTGHFGMLYDKKVIEYLYNYLYGRKV